MPNHVANILTVKGAPKAVKAFFAAVDGGVNEDGKPMFIDFNKIRPMPEALNVKSGTITDRSLDYYVLKLTEQSGTPAVLSVLGDYADRIYRRLPETMSRQRARKDADDMPELLKLGERCFNNIREHGAPTWYEWRIKNWDGTKWNAYHQTRAGDNTIAFQTAWVGVPKLLQELSAQHPDVEMSYVFADEDWGSGTGAFEFRGGECTFEHQPPDGSPAAREIAGQLLGPPFEEESEGEDEIKNHHGKGYVVAVCQDADDPYITGALHIERDDSKASFAFENDEQAARVAERDGFTLIYGMDGVENGVYLDTPKNRGIISTYLERQMDEEDWGQGDDD